MTWRLPRPRRTSSIIVQRQMTFGPHVNVSVDEGRRGENPAIEFVHLADFTGREASVAEQGCGL